jgi:hypothetical protein
VKRELSICVLTLVTGVSCNAPNGSEATSSDDEAIRKPIDGAPPPPPTDTAPSRLAPSRPPPSAAAPFTDLEVLGTLTFDPTTNVMTIPIINHGTATAYITSGKVRLGPNTTDVWDATQYADSPSPSPYSIGSGATGYLVAGYRAGLLDECKRYRVTIDVNHTMQTDRLIGVSVFNNDSGIVKTPCPLRWTSIIDETRALGIYPDTVTYDVCDGPSCSAVSTPPSAVAAPTPDPSEVGPSAPALNPNLLGKTLQGIVSSQQSPFDGGVQVCTSCHTQAREKEFWYLPPAGTIDKDQLIPVNEDNPSPWVFGSGVIEEHEERTWSGLNGWAIRFVSVHYVDTDGGTGDYVKLPYMRALMQKWIDDGFQ